MSLKDELALAKTFDRSELAYCVIKVLIDENNIPYDWEFIYLNDALARIEGLPKEKLLNNRFFEIFPNADRKWFEYYYPAAYEGKSFVFEDISEEIGVYLKIRCFPIEKGYCGCILEDIRSEHEVKKSNSELAMIYGALCRDVSSLYVIDLKTGREHCYAMNENFREEYWNTFNYGEYDELISSYLENGGVAEADKNLFEPVGNLEKLKETIDTQENYAFNYRVFIDGQKQDQQAHFVKMVNDGQEFCIMAFSDINELVARELEQKQLIEDALARAEAASRSKTTFLSNMSHDIRTPMNAIIGFTALATAHIDNREQVLDYLGKITTSGNHLLSLINDILDMSRIESGKIVLEDVEFSLAELMHEMKNILQADMKKKCLDFYVDTIDVFDENIICDRLRLSQIFLNVLGNAIKFTEPGGNISLRIIEKKTKKKGIGEYEFRIKDTGIGMSKEFQKHLFEPFERERTSTVSRKQGTGLGMPITKHIVEMMGGQIEVESEQNKGTEFIITLPLKLQNKQDHDYKIEEMENLRALVVDDDFNTCDSVSMMLQQIGMRTEWTMSGKEAVLRAEQAIKWKDPYNVYLIDWLIPDMNGVEVARRIRRVVGEDCPIIIVTAYDWADIEDEAYEAGVTAFCSKPLFISELRRCLMNILHPEKDKPADEILHQTIEGRLLLVEDNDLNREIAAEILSEVGLMVEEAENGLEALKKLESRGAGYYDLVLMDVQMPVMDGYEATQRIRNFDDKVLANVPVIAMTANAFEEDKKKSLEIGMNGHISKPIEIDKLMDMIREIVKK